MNSQVKIDISGLENVKKRMFSRLAERQTEKLLDYAPLMLKKAFNQKSFKSETWNLADSYVWVVYYKGEVKGSGYLWGGRYAKEDSNYHHNKINGRRLAESFIGTYIPKERNGWEIVWAATAPYSIHLEQGSRGKKFEVISSVYDEIVSDFGNRAKVFFEINH